MTNVRFDLKTLCAEAGVTPRTVHFYIQAGLLRPAGTPGPGNRYDEGHLSRLRLIKLLQNEHLPLAEIRRRLEDVTDEEAGAVVNEYRTKKVSSHSSAADYIRSVLEGERRDQSTSALYVAAIAKPPTSQRAPERSQWERITLAPDIELHIRRPLSRLQNRKIERLMEFARDLFEEEIP